MLPESDAWPLALERALPRLFAAESRIIELRNNGGGNARGGLDILSYQSKQAIAGAVGEAMLRAKGYPAVNWGPLPGNGQTHIKPIQRIFPAPWPSSRGRERCRRPRTSCWPSNLCNAARFSARPPAAAPACRQRSGFPAALWRGSALLRIPS
jgi:hypothetical protein